MLLKHRNKMNDRRALYAAAILAIALSASPAFAASTGMPWEGPLEQIVDSITGPVAKFGGVVAIALTGLSFANSDSGSVQKRLIGIVFGLSIAFSAASFGIGLFGYKGGAVF